MISSTGPASQNQTPPLVFRHSLLWQGRTVQREEKLEDCPKMMSFKVIFRDKPAISITLGLEKLRDHSGYFRTLTDWKRADTKKEHQLDTQEELQLNMHAFSDETVTTLFQSLDTLPALSEENITEMLLLTDILQFDDLKTKCEQWLLNHLESFDDGEVLVFNFLNQGCFPLLASYALKIKVREGDDLEPFLQRYGKFLSTLTFHELKPQFQNDDFLKLASEHCPNLEHLSLSYSKVTDKGMAYLPRFKGLTSLSMIDCIGITDEGFKYIDSLSSLKTLNMTSCKQFSDAGIGIITKLSQLEDLRLAYCRKLTVKTLPVLEQCKKLSRLDLAGIEELRPFTNEIEAKLKLKASPGPTALDIKALFKFTTL